MAMQMSDAPRPPRRRQTSGRNEGSIWWRADRRTWVAEVSLPSGRSRTTHCASRGQAKTALKALLATVQAPLAMPPNCSLGRYLPYWLAQSARQLDPKTYSGYRGIMVNHVIPELGKVRLDRLTVIQLESYFELLSTERGLAPQTVRNHRMALQAALTDAERWTVIPRGSNPAGIAKIPRVPSVPRITFSVPQIRTFLADPHPSRLHALFVLDLC